jgi:hypothetical protein
MPAAIVGAPGLRPGGRGRGSHAVHAVRFGPDGLAGCFLEFDSSWVPPSVVSNVPHGEGPCMIGQ